MSAIRVCKLLVGIYSVPKTICRRWTWIFKTRSHACHNAWCFPFWYIFKSCSQWVQVYLRLLYVLAVLFSCYSPIPPFCHVLYFCISSPELFWVLYIPLFIWLHVFSTDLWVKFSFVIFEGTVLLVQLDLGLVFFEFSIYRQYFWFILLILSVQSFYSIVFLCIFPSLVLSLVLVVSSFVLLASFSIKRFVFLFVFFRKIPILLLTA